MNVYDFDGTIYPSDCSIGFCIWCMNHHPKLWITFFPKALSYLIRRKTGKMTEASLQRKFFRYLTLIDDFDVQIRRYWDKNEKKIVPWYLAQKRPDDLIISASPTCIIEPIARRLGVNFMASEYDREWRGALEDGDRKLLFRFPGRHTACLMRGKGPSGLE